MKLGGSYSKHFEVPSEGVHNAVLAAVQDLGMIESSFSGEEHHKLRLVWILEDCDALGEHLLVLQRVTNSSHEKSILRKTITGILGRDPGEGAVDDTLILGAQCQLRISHNESQGRTYANVDEVTKQGKKSAKIEIPEGWKPPKVKKYKPPPDSDVPF